MDLLEYMNEMNREKESPLASRLRPTTLDEVVGQEHIIGKDKLLYRAIKADKLSSILLYGPPGTGKTDTCESDRGDDKSGIFTDQCDICRKKRYGRSGRKSKKKTAECTAKRRFYLSTRFTVSIKASRIICFLLSRWNDSF